LVNIVCALGGFSVLFWAQTALKPEIRHVHGYNFPQMYAFANAFNIANKFSASCFLINWFILATRLAWIPAFSLIFETFRIAAKPIAMFFIIFFIVFSGFAFAFAFVFDLNKDFRSIAHSFQSLFRMLLGDLGADELFEEEPVLAPILYFTFVATCTLVTFNILITILMDGWAEAKQRAASMDERKKQEQHIDVARSFWEFIASLPVLRYLNHWAIQQAVGEERAVIRLQRFYRSKHDRRDLAGSCELQAHPL
jgi:hypothetical protein